jgi:hypothetical protein
MLMSAVVSTGHNRCFPLKTAWNQHAYGNGIEKNSNIVYQWPPRCEVKGQHQTLVTTMACRKRSAASTGDCKGPANILILCEVGSFMFS